VRIHPIVTMAAVALGVVILYNRYGHGAGKGLRVGP
jgi:hypothetical protein